MDYVTPVCCLLAFLVYYNTLDAGFVYDDRRAIITNDDITTAKNWTNAFFNDFWGTPLSSSGTHGSYRPLSVLTFRLNYLLDGYEPFGYHLANVILHVIATSLFIQITKRILPKSLKHVGSLLSGLTFAVHPIHTEAVASIVGRADLLSAITFMLSFLAYTAHVKNRNIYYFIPEHAFPQYDLRYLKNWQKDVLKSATIKMLKRNAEMTQATEKNKTWLIYFKVWFYLLLCLGLSILGLLCKETGITVLAVCFVYDLVATSFDKQKQRRSLYVLAVTTLLTLTIRFHYGSRPVFSKADNPTAKDPCVLTRFYTFAYLPVFNFFIMLFPKDLSFDWGMDSIPKLKTLADPRNFMSLCFYAGSVWLAQTCISKLNTTQPSCSRHKMITIKINQKNKRENATQCLSCHRKFINLHCSKCPFANNNNGWNMSCDCNMPEPACREMTVEGAILICMALLAIPFLPATNIVFHVGFVVAERILYIPSAGMCILGGLIGGYFWQSASNVSQKRMLVCVFGIVLVSFGVRTVMRNEDWYDEESLFRSAIHINPPKALGNLGSVLNTAGRKAEAEAALRQALVYKPNMADVHYNLGVLLHQQKRLNEAIFSFQRAIHFRSSLALAYINLASALTDAKRSEEAKAVLRQASMLSGHGLKDQKQHNSAKMNALLQLGELYSHQGRLHRALEIYTEAAATNVPENYPRQKVFNMLGKTLRKMKRNDEAEKWYRAAVQTLPSQAAAYIRYGKMIAKNVSRSNEAEQWFRKAQKIAPNDPAVYHNYGEFLVYQHKFVEAAYMYEKAAELAPEDYQLAAAAAIAMRQAGRPLDAERWYRQAVVLKPSDAVNLSNLGAILHLNGKYKEAAQNYRASLAIEPNDAITLTNLNRLHSLMT